MKKTKRERSTIFVHTVAILGAGIASLMPLGCGTPPPPDLTVPPGALNSSKEAKYTAEAALSPKADAGVPITNFKAEDGLVKLKALVAERTFPSRPDPFALLAVERSFDVSQTAERYLQLQSGFQTDWTPPAEPAPEEIEVQPYRRLAGVMVGDSILAMIDMGDGKPLRIVHPGEQIEGTEWTVVSIDSEKAVLRRSGNKKPKEIIVALGSSLSGIIIQPTGSGAGAAGGGRTGGGPGGPPGSAGAGRGGPGAAGGGS
jgi:hypothetical protein